MEEFYTDLLDKDEQDFFDGTDGLSERHPR
jgi:hypothetical protein